jgi:hypothetical protein
MISTREEPTLVVLQQVTIRKEAFEEKTELDAIRRRALRGEHLPDTLFD